MIRIYDTNGPTLVSEFKMSTNQTLNFSLKGGNGGNGGNLTIIKDPSVKEFNINYQITCGRGGAEHNASMSGRDGRDGTFKEEVRAVKM